MKETSWNFPKFVMFFMVGSLLIFGFIFRDEMPDIFANWKRVEQFQKAKATEHARRMKKLTEPTELEILEKLGK